jgi:hypothetical protein
MPDAPNSVPAPSVTALQAELDEALGVARLDANIGRGAMVQITATAIDCGDENGKPLTLHVIERTVGKIDKGHSERWGITSIRDLGRGATWRDAFRNAKPPASEYGKGRRG